METMYVRTGNEEWKRTAKFWMTLFGINFAIGVATGIILEFEFGTNWSNFSWFAGDMFGAPLAIEGMFAFFIEATFVAIMFFGWNKFSKKAHLISTWMVAIGATLSAVWILIANAWMQNPVGTHFNPDTARFEMSSFWEVVTNPVAISKFFHTATSSYMMGAIFVIGVSCWFLIKKRNVDFALRSIKVAALFGVAMSVLTVFTGDNSGQKMGKHQPMKLAASEALYDGAEGSSLSVIGVIKPGAEVGTPQEDVFSVNIEIPKMLSFMTYHDLDAYIPGINDLTLGSKEHGLMPAEEKIRRGKLANEALKEYNTAIAEKNKVEAERLRKKFDKTTEEGKEFYESYFQYFGYGFLNNPYELVPNVPLTYYSFRVMVAAGFFFILLFVLVILFHYKKKLENMRWLQWIALLSIPLVYLASQCGWVVAEVGRQPWVIQDLLPTMAAVSNIEASSVQITFFLFLTLFAILLIAELKIMITQIKLGPKDEGGNEK
jgi:cytochrome d ubiquinol oxidase subunit I